MYFQHLLTWVMRGFTGAVYICVRSYQAEIHSFSKSCGSESPYGFSRHRIWALAVSEETESTTPRKNSPSYSTSNHWPAVTASMLCTVSFAVGGVVSDKILLLAGSGVVASSTYGVLMKNNSGL